MSAGVCFETKCYEGDWRFLLEKDRLQQMIERCNYAFAEKVLMINNVKDLTTVKRTADKFVAANVIDRYHVVDEYAEKALAFFDIRKESFAGGYYYSIAELVSIMLCRQQYLLHFSGDAMMKPSHVNWIDGAIGIFRARPDILVANPTWNSEYRAARKVMMTEDDNWFYSYGFSDQCYLIDAERFRQQIYNETNPASERYPKYGGYLFEKRVDAYMRNHHMLRITSKHCTYVHRNFPKSLLGKRLKLYFSKPGIGAAKA